MEIYVLAMNLRAVISGDIVAYTGLQAVQKKRFEEELTILFDMLQESYTSYIRVVKGDYIEAVSSPQQSLRVAILLKTYIKYIMSGMEDAGDRRIEYGKNIGIRLAVGIGTLDRFDAKKGIIDGEAIYLSGRQIAGLHTFGKKKIHIRQSMFFKIGNPELDAEMDAIYALIDNLLNRASGKQCRVLYYKLQGKSEMDIAGLLQISRQVVNRHSVSAGWHALNKAVLYYENKMSRL
jgi:hypothetical protein